MVVDPTQREFASTKLKKTSLLRLHKLATIHVSSLVRFLGILEAGPMASAAAKLRLLLNL